jgi:hypothetical protein
MRYVILKGVDLHFLNEAHGHNGLSVWTLHLGMANFEVRGLVLGLLITNLDPRRITYGLPRCMEHISQVLSEAGAPGFELGTAKGENHERRGLVLASPSCSVAPNEKFPPNSTCIRVVMIDS